MTRPSWDVYFLGMALHASTRSKDQSTQVGAVIVEPASKAVISTGYNGFPCGVWEGEPLRNERPEKYVWTSHAEENAILLAARTGRSTNGAILYCTHPPCHTCCRLIIGAGITCTYSPAGVDVPTMKDSIQKGRQMLFEAGVHRIEVKQ